MSERIRRVQVVSARPFGPPWGGWILCGTACEIKGLPENSRRYINQAPDHPLRRPSSVSGCQKEGTPAVDRATIVELKPGDEKDLGVLKLPAQ